LEKSHKIISGMQELEGMSKNFLEKEEPEICISIDGICLNSDLLTLFKSFIERHSHFINEPNSLEMASLPL